MSAIGDASEIFTLDRRNLGRLPQVPLIEGLSATQNRDALPEPRRRSCNGCINRHDRGQLLDGRRFKQSTFRSLESVYPRDDFDAAELQRELGVSTMRPLLLRSFALEPGRPAIGDRLRLPSHPAFSGLRDPALGVLAGLVVAFVVVSQEAHLFTRLLVLASAFALALLASSEVFLAFFALLLAVSSMLDGYSLHVGPATVYATDVLVMLAVVRAVAPVDRFPSARALGPVVGGAVSVWACLMVVAGVRAWYAGETMVTIVRFETALLYFPVLYLSLSRVLREKRLDLSRLWRMLAFVSVGLVVWMFVMRILNIPFEGQDTMGHLGQVVTSEGSVVRRDFGAASAFIIYPLLGLAGVAGMVYSSHRKATALLAFAGILATFVTLIRGEIFGLTLGIAAILVLRSKGSDKSSRFHAASVLAAGCAAGLLAVAYVNPQVRDAIVERSLPGIATESRAAQQTAEYRMEALRLGSRVARTHVNGIGFRNEQFLTESKIDPGYLGHSTPAWLLVFTGWPGLAASTLVLWALLARSFRISSDPPWLHSAFIGILLLMVVYSFGAAGLVAQPWVIGLFALVTALRFSLNRPFS